MSNKLKNCFKFTGRSAVWLTLVVVLFLMTTEAAPSISNHFLKTTLFKGNIPMEIVSWFWCAILGSYCCGFQFFQILESRQMPEGNFTLGDVERLKKLMIAALIAAIYGTCLNMFFGVDIGLEGLITAYFVDVLCFVIGRRAIESQKYVTVPDEDECDLNRDGCIDWKDVQEKYASKGVSISEKHAKNILNDFIRNLKIESIKEETNNENEQCSGKTELLAEKQ